MELYRPPLSYGTQPRASTSGGGIPAQPPGQPIGQTPEQRKALEKIYRPEYGIAMTDAEYAQRKQVEASNNAVNQARGGQPTGYSTPNIPPQPFSFPTTPNGDYSGNQVSNYTGQPTSSLDADRARLALESQFASQNASQQNQFQNQFLDKQNQFQREGIDRSAQLQKEAEERRIGYLPQLTASLPGVVSRGGGISGGESAGRAAAFARAKEQAGGTALSALRSLGNLAAERGQTGSSMERNMIGGVVGGAAGQVNEFTRDQLMADLQREAELADMEYQGQITQRGQNMALTPSLLGLVGARGLY